jgi:lipoate-protein ligase A
MRTESTDPPVANLRALVITDKRSDGAAAHNMALDELLLDSDMASGRLVCRLYEWRPAAVSIGRNQKVAESVNVDVLREAGITLVRRPTGGRAIWHCGDVCFTFSGLTPGSGRKISAFKSDYMRAASAIVRMLRFLGIQANISAGQPSGSVPGGIKSPCFQSSGRFEITVKDKKMVGIAQYRSGDRFLIQGSIRRSAIDEMYRKLFFVQGDVGDAVYDQLRNTVTSIEENMKRKVDFGGLLDAFTSGVEARLSDRIEREALVDRAEIDNMKNEKYDNREWNYRF